jgi:serine/threonine protein kinase
MRQTRRPRSTSNEGPPLNPPNERISDPAWWEGRRLVHRNEIFLDFEGKEYRLIEIIGRGTYSDVFKCEIGAHTFKFAAIKLFRNSASYLSAGEHELAIHEMLSPGPDLPGRDYVVSPIAVLDLDGYIGIAFPLFVPFTLPVFNDSLPQRAGRIRTLVSSILEALRFCHAAGVMHLDVKPGNLLYDRDEPEYLRLIDFASARTGGSDAAAPNTVQTRHYRSPEVILGLPFGAAADMWSAGCVIAEFFLQFPLFGFGCEFDVMQAIVGVVGARSEVVETSPRRDEFFEEVNGTFRPREDAVSVFRERHEAKDILNEGITMEDFIPGPELQPFRDLLVGLLEFDPGKRLTADGALALPYVQLS